MSFRHKIFASVIFASFLFGWSVFCLPGACLAAGGDLIAGELIVKFKGDAAVYKIKLQPDADLKALIFDYQSRPEIEFIEPNYILTAAAFPNDPLFNLQWYDWQIGVKELWSRELLVREQEKIQRRPIIAIIDSGVFLNHPDLKDKIWRNDRERRDGIDNDQNGYIDDINGWNFVDNNSDVNPRPVGNYDVVAVNHGTIVAGLAAAAVNNNEGISGVNWFGEIMPLRVLDNNGSGDVYSVIMAINYAVDKGADVINMSFTGDEYSQGLFNAIKRANDAGVIVVAAAGNTDPKANGLDLDVTKSYPVCFDAPGSKDNLVIGVASVGKDLKKSDFSSYGFGVDIVAPGQDIYSTLFYDASVLGFSQYYSGYWSGTSLSAPLVSGVIAAIKAVRPNLSAVDIKNYVLSSTKNIYPYNPAYLGKLGSGLLDAGKAFSAAISNPVPTQVTGRNKYIIAALGYGSFPQIKIIRPDGSVFKEFYAYSVSFNGPIYAVAGDVNGDGDNEIITGAGSSGGPHVKVFDVNGHLLSQFFAYDSRSRGGVSVSAGDIDGDGLAEIIAGPGKGQKPEVKIFNMSGKLLYSFYAYDESFIGGVKIATGDFNWDNKMEIVTAAGSGGGPHIKVFAADGKLIYQFFAFNSLSKNGVNIAVGDVHGDGQPEIIAALEKDGNPEVRVFSYQGKLLNGFYAYEPGFYQGLALAVIDINHDNVGEIITGPNSGHPAEIKAFDREGMNKFILNIYSAAYRGGVRPAALTY